MKRKRHGVMVAFDAWRRTGRFPRFLVFNKVRKCKRFSRCKTKPSIQPYSFAWQRPDIKAPYNPCLQQRVEDSSAVRLGSARKDPGFLAEFRLSPRRIISRRPHFRFNLCQSQSRDHDLPPVRGRCLPGLHPRRSAHHDGSSIVERVGGCFAFHLLTASEKGCCGDERSIGNDESCFQ